VVGFVTVICDEIEELYVTPGAQGSGVADTLLRQGERAVRDGGFSVAWLAVVAGNDRARRFYEREGWHDAGSFHHQARIKDRCITVPAHRYERRLALCGDAADTNDGDGDVLAEIPSALVERLRAVCAAHAGVVEEPAWTGLRWRSGRTAIANLVLIRNGWPPAYARAARTTGPQCVLTVRSDMADVDALAATGGPYFAPVWGATWNPSVLGIRLDDSTDWSQIAEHIDNSHHLATNQAPRRQRTTSPRSPRSSAEAHLRGTS
jgi:hypothetical protein